MEKTKAKAATKLKISKIGDGWFIDLQGRKAMPLGFGTKGPFDSIILALGDVGCTVNPGDRVQIIIEA